MRILLTGATGLLGPAFASLAADAGHEIIGVAGRPGTRVPGASRLEVADLRRPEALDSLWLQASPEAVVNAAAVAEPAACDADPAGSQALNVELPARLAALAAQHGVRLLHLSSEQVFDGEHAPYTISAPPAPLHLYGRQKAESERCVLAACPAAAVLRAPLLLGNSLSGRRSPHEKMFEQWAAGRLTRLYTDEFRQVCSATNLASVLLELVTRPELQGILHWAGAHPVSRWEMGRYIAARFGLGEQWLQPLSRAAVPDISATRPRDLTMDLVPLNQQLRTQLETLEQAAEGLIVPPSIREWLNQNSSSPPIS